MKAVQREDFDRLAQLLIEAGHLFNFLWVGHEAGIQLLIASVNIGDHQHHELHRSSPLYFGPAPLVQTILFAHPLLYSSWRRHQRPISLRPLGARSSHWYMPQRPSTP